MGGVFGYLLDFGKCILDLHPIRKCKCRVRKEEGGAQCNQGMKGHLYMRQY